MSDPMLALPLPGADDLRNFLISVPDPENTGCYIVGWQFDDAETGRARVDRLIEAVCLGVA